MDCIYIALGPSKAISHSHTLAKEPFKHIRTHTILTSRRRSRHWTSLKDTLTCAMQAKREGTSYPHGHRINTG